jgi:uncharacterized integral membrane protein
MRVFKIGLWVVFTIGFLAVAVALIGQNTDELTVTLFNYSTVPAPKWVVLLITLLVGALLSTLFFILELIILETKNIRLRRANQRLERLIAKDKPAVAANASTEHEAKWQSEMADDTSDV